MMIAVQILLVIVSLVLIVSVLMQSSESDGMGAISGGSETFFGKNKNSSFEGKLALITKISACMFVALALLLVILS